MCIFFENGKLYKQNCQLELHLRSHIKEKPVLCVKCTASFPSCGQISVHVRYVHNKERNFKCNVCEKCFANKPMVVRHTTTHLAEEPFGCTECGRRFRSREGLKGHMERHLNQPTTLCVENPDEKASKRRVYSRKLCMICNKLVAGLKVHMRTHTNQRPYPCPKCSHRSKRKSHLVTHLKKHSVK